VRAGGFSGHITAGGHFATFHSRELLEGFPDLDSILHGEGEQAMQDLLAALDHPESVAGMSWRNGDGHIVDNPLRRQPRALDDYPLPTRPAKFHQYLGLPIANMLSGRGCYGACRFCSIRAWHAKIGGSRFRQRRVESVAQEMADLYHQRGVRIFNFHDDNFLSPKKADSLDRIGRLRRALKDHGINRIGFQIKARPDSIDREVVASLKEIGLFRVFLGVETNAVAGLLTLGRGIRREQNSVALEILREAGIHTSFNLLMFDPETTLEDLRQNIAFVARQAEFPLNFCRVEVYAGTDIHRQLHDEDRLQGDYFGYSYRIRDPRVQSAYEIFREVFYPRNFAINGMNHRAIAVGLLLPHFAAFLSAAGCAGTGTTRQGSGRGVEPQQCHDPGGDLRTCRRARGS
jgi:anaerobic magnesium-protoporphyrin IX monomethyl ester cyclase